MLLMCYEELKYTCRKSFRDMGPKGIAPFKPSKVQKFIKVFGTKNVNRQTMSSYCQGALKCYSQ